MSGAGVAILAIPTPREIDVSCGQSLLLLAEDEPRALALLAESRVTWSKLFRRNGAMRVYEKIKDFEG